MATDAKIPFTNIGGGSAYAFGDISARQRGNLGREIRMAEAALRKVVFLEVSVIMRLHSF